MSQPIITVSVMINGGKITLEGPKDFVEAEVRRLTDMLANQQQSNAVLPQGSAQSTELISNSERELIVVKKPKGHHEIVAVLAFYLMEHGQEEFTEEDIRRAYIRAGVKPPKFVGQALRDAKNKFDYIEQGSERGTYRLSNHGDRTVRFDLGKDK
jgi:hypothetical protein